MTSAPLNDKCPNPLVRAIWLLPILLAGCQTAATGGGADGRSPSGARTVAAGDVMSGGGATNIVTGAPPAPETPMGSKAPDLKAVNETDVDLDMGRALIAAGDPQSAVTLLTRYVEKRPGDWRGAVALGVALDLAGRGGDSMAHYERALRLSPGNPAILNNMAMSNALAGRLDEATALLRRASESGDAPDKVRGNMDLVRQLRADQGPKRGEPS